MAEIVSGDMSSREVALLLQTFVRTDDHGLRQAILRRLDGTVWAQALMQQDEMLEAA